jgi:hypothetical protein
MIEDIALQATAGEDEHQAKCLPSRGAAMLRPYKTFIRRRRWQILRRLCRRI